MNLLKKMRGFASRADKHTLKKNLKKKSLYRRINCVRALFSASRQEMPISLSLAIVPDNDVELSWQFSA